MERKAVLDIYLKKKIEEFTPEKREEELSELTFGDWSNTEGWNLLPKEIRDSMKNDSFPENAEDAKYDQVLLFKFRDHCKGYTNDYLTLQTGLEIKSGKPADLETCPCCGLKTIEERFHYEICTVCWWEDDGQDNNTAESFSGPNSGTSLMQGRINFIKHGIYDAERDDLFEFQQEAIKFEIGRTFAINNDYLYEMDTNWKIKIVKE